MGHDTSAAVKNVAEAEVLAPSSSKLAETTAVSCAAKLALAVNRHRTKTSMLRIIQASLSVTTFSRVSSIV